MEKFILAICQIDVDSEKKVNLKNASEKAKIVVLPEMFNAPYDSKTFNKYAESYPDITTEFLSKTAKEFNIILVGGSIPEIDNNKMYNTSYTFNEKGILIAKHRKMHLFDIDIKNKITFKESSVLSAGDKVTVFDTGYIKIGIAICYDMRFPELMRSMVDKGAKLIIIPAAFNTVTGPAHWHITSRARAIDNQIYFAVASPARSQILSYKAYGHSLIVNPWGNIITEANEKEEIIYAEIDLNYIDKVREELPLLKHIKRDCY